MENKFYTERPVLSEAEVSRSVPQLRFPEFLDHWNEKKLGQIGNFIGGGTPESTKKEYWEGNIPWISSSDIKEDNIQEIDITRFITEKAIGESATKIIPENSVLIVSRVGIGKFAVAKQDLCTSQDFTNLITDENSFFLAYYFKARSNRFVRLSQGTSIKGFTGKDIKSAKFLIPTPPEQTRIATFLTAIDKRINLLQKKKTELEQYKKGVMQKLFAQEMRFKIRNQDGELVEPPDWEEKKLGAIGTFQTSSVDKLSKDNEKKVFLVNYMNVYRHEDINNSTREKLQVVTAKENQIKSSDLKKGDILFTPSSETPTDIGHSVVIFEDLENTLFSYHLMRFRPNIELDLLYSHYFCNIPSVLKQLSSFSTGSTRFTISVGNFSKVKVQLPSFYEQQKIANFLSSIDKSIEKIGNQIDGSVEFKQGSLQKMFI